jgi:hypothetical protein
MISNSVQGQSKKKQIELLNGKLDSLNEVVFNERNNYTQTVQLKDAEMSSQKRQIIELDHRIDSLYEVVSNERNNYTQAVQLKDSLVQLKDAEIYSQKNQINQLIQGNDRLNTQLNELEGDKMILTQEQSSLERSIDSLNQEIAELGNTIPENAITVYGVIKSEQFFDYDHWYEVKILEGSLTNITELYLSAYNTGEDINYVNCICPPSDDSDLEGAKFIAIVIKSERSMTNDAYGGIMTFPCYRPLFLKRL